MNVVLTIRSDLFYTNNVTLLLDKYRKPKNTLTGFRHFLFVDKEVKGNKYLLRYPGNTIGYILTNDEMIIKEIKI